MSGRPWMPLYVADYLADTGHLSAAEHGAYMLLILHYWQNAGLPTDDRRLARISRMSEMEWAESRDTLADFFDSNWTHKRIEAELAKAEDISSKRRASAQERHSKSNANASANAELLHTQSQSQSPLQKTDTKTPSQSAPLTPRGGKRAHPIPPDWKPNEDCLQYGGELGHSHSRILEMAEDMRIWAGSAGGKNTLKKDWFLTFKGWMRREHDRPNGHAPPSAAKSSPYMQAAREIRQEQTDARTPPNLLTHRRA